MSAEQRLDAICDIVAKSISPDVSFLEKFGIFDHTEMDVLPLNSIDRIYFFQAICGNKETRQKLLALSEKNILNQTDWKTNISTFLNNPRSTPINDAAFAASSIRKPQINILSKWTCIKCDGVGHKANICP